MKVRFSRPAGQFPTQPPSVSYPFEFPLLQRGGPTELEGDDSIELWLFEEKLKKLEAKESEAKSPPL